MKVRTIIAIVLLIVAWWVGASGLVTMDDVGGWINTAQEKIED